MWLIDTRTLRLQFFMSTQGVKYAILSHTWGEEEVDFQEMRARGPFALPKAGWQKIVETCRIARETFGLDYAWVDTCCIDKSSSAELSEAINSMFSWYKAATICLVHLQDLTPTPGESLLPGSAPLRDRLRACRWFTRGWTLQELIAPAQMVFYDGNWTIIAQKDQLISDLSEVTGIEEDFLRNVDYLSAAHIGKKMSWASSRQTTRIEDQAYCLLGIFDVNMPLLYGEGEKAFLRLQQEIARSSNDLTLFAWQQHLSAPILRGIFATSPAEFRNCNKIRVPVEPLHDVEFSLTNRGLRFDRSLDTQFGRSALALDCVECSDRTGNLGMWVNILLTKIGPRYARVFPFRLGHSPSRTQNFRGTTSEDVVYVAPTVPQSLARSISSNPTTEIVYTAGLLRCVQLTGGSGQRLHAVPGEVDVVPFRAFRGNDGHVGLNDLPGIRHEVLNESLFLMDSFTSNSVNPRYCHTLDLGLNASVRPMARIVMACGVSRMGVHGGTKSQGVIRPWAALLDFETILGCHNQPISNPDLSKKTVALRGPLASVPEDERVRMGMVHDYVFKEYSDEAGSLRFEDLPTTVTITEAHSQVRHQVTVHTVIKLRGYGSIALALSYKRIQ